MIEDMRPSENFQFQWDPRLETTLHIRIAGPGLGRLAALRDTAIGERDAAIPDPVEVLAKAVAQEMLPAADPDKPQVFDIKARSYDARLEELCWSVEASNLDAGAARLLANLLVAREMDAIKVVAGASSAAMPPMPDTLAYPSLTETPSFDVDYRPPQRRNRERRVEITLTAPPDDAELQDLYQRFSDWTALLLLGAYAPDDRLPQNSTAFAQPAVLRDPVTIEQTFETVFFCHEAAFAPLVTCFSRQSNNTQRPTRVLIR